MILEYEDKKVDLQPCPFCGSGPAIRGYTRHVHWYRIRCADEMEVCRMLPETTACRKLEDAAADWNMRHQSQDEALEELWWQFADVPMNPETECMDEAFRCWPKGTPREDIWRWFDERHSKGVAYLLYGPTEKEETP